jgi:fatty-acid desaturase
MNHVSVTVPESKAAEARSATESSGTTQPIEEKTAIEKSNDRDPFVDDQLVVNDDIQSRVPYPEGVDEKSRYLWEYIIPVLAFHLMVPLAFLPSMFSWWGVAWLFVGNFIFTSLGIGAGYHRLLTHRGFECPRWFEYVLTTLGVCSFQDSPARWVLVHRVHHQHSDHQNDPHTPKVTTFWSHMGWLFVDNRSLSTGTAYDKYARDIMRDDYYRWLQRRMNWVWVYVAHAALIAIGAMVVGLAWGMSLMDAYWFTVKVVLWGVVLRTVFTWHVTWGINSFSHMWGYRNYETREDSRNNWLFAFLTNGEGWHNNHHADPRSARHGHRVWEIDLTWAFLWCAEKIGLVSGLVRPNERALERKSITP